VYEQGRPPNSVLARNDQVISQIQLSADSGDLFLPPNKMHHLLLAALLGFGQLTFPTRAGM
jgi:hypothetical protein